jgi:hypothetical protein
VQRERGREQERDPGHRADAGQHAEQGAEEDAGERVEQVLPLERDSESLGEALEHRVSESPRPNGQGHREELAEEDDGDDGGDEREEGQPGRRQRRDHPAEGEEDEQGGEAEADPGQEQGVEHQEHADQGDPAPGDRPRGRRHALPECGPPERGQE